jgi:hypothetical protein
MRPLSCLFMAATLLASALALAQGELQPVFRGEPPGWATLLHPYRVAAQLAPRVAPVWTREGLLAAPPTGLRGLVKTAYSGIPAYDPAADAWFATAEGCLVRVEPDGRLPVLVSGVQGVDLDVRAAQGLAVTREPDDKIVLWRFDGRRMVLLEGAQYFRPRFSPDGTRVLVAESRAEGGHFWLVTLDGKATDLGQGYGATWHPDGRRVVFTRVSHDGHVVRASSVLVLELATRRESLLAARTEAPALLDPAISLDGKAIAFAGATGDQIAIAPLREGGR